MTCPSVCVKPPTILTNIIKVLFRLTFFNKYITKKLNIVPLKPITNVVNPEIAKIANIHDFKITATKENLKS